MTPWARWARLALRLALGATFLSAVADRFGLYGRFGSEGVAWGDWGHFVAYAAQLNWFLTPSLNLAAAAVATALEVVLGVLLIAGLLVRPAALASGCLLLIFALTMLTGVGFTAPLTYSVYTAAAAAFLLAATPDPPKR